MKHILLSLLMILFVLFLFTCSKDIEVDSSQLQKKDGLFYEIGSKKPFSGTAMTSHENGELKLSKSYKNGKLDGLTTLWDLEGRKIQKKIYTDNVIVEAVRWHENGEMKFKCNFKGGKPDGLASYWNSEGDKLFENVISDHLPQRKLRSESKYLSNASVDFMCSIMNFYDYYKNPKGKGYSNNYKENKDTIIDETSGLMWQRAGSRNVMKYGGINSYIDSINSNEFAGFIDWRLPTLEEALSLMESERKNGILYVDAVFDSVQYALWTSDKRQEEITRYTINFKFGVCGSVYMDSKSYVRAVRTVEQPEMAAK